MSRKARIVSAVVFAIAVGVFWRTAYPSITWWDSSNYSLAAHTLGLTSPPGSLLLTLLGWPVTHLPLGMTPARVLNLFAGVLAGFATALVLVVALRLHRMSSPTQYVTGSILAGMAAGALTFAFSATLWEHAIKFTPYVLTVVFTGLILWTLLQWWEAADDRDSWRWLFLLALLFGLDFSVHRTNALLIPGALAWVAIRRPRTLTSASHVSASVGGLALGLALQLLMIPIARYSHSPLMMYEPSTLARFWSYLSIEGQGGGFLINLWPRKSPFWSIQVGDVIRIFSDNFLHWKTSASVLGALPAIAGFGGFVVLFRRAKRLALAWTLALFLQVAFTIIYFNIPKDFFRPFDRHYLPIFLMFAVTIAIGLGALANTVALRVRQARVVPVLAAILIAVIPVAQLAGNWSAHDASKRHFTEDYARNALASLPHNAIYFTVGDNDTFPVMYMQYAEGVRTDVQLLNWGLATLDWYIDQIRRRDPAFPVTAGPTEWLAHVRARDSVLVVPVDGTGDTTRTVLRPAYGRDFWLSEMAVMDIARTNRWRRPITFALTTGSLTEWLTPQPLYEGLHVRVDPTVSDSLGITRLRENLLEKYEYRGYADPAVRMEPESRTMAFQYYTAFAELLKREYALGRVHECREAREKYLSAFPPERTAFADNFRQRLAGMCGA